MTGFGAAEGPAGTGRLRVEIRTVNHRFFNFASKLPSELASLEGEIRERVRQELERGHVTVSARWVESPAGEPTLALDLDRAREAAAKLGELKAALGLTGDVSLELLARQPNVFGARASEQAEVTFVEVEPIVAQAASDCRAMRKREGARLASALEGHLQVLEGRAAEVEALAPTRLVRERDRLRASVAQLLDGRSLDEQRLAQEIALLADRLDITEELVRLRAHIAACRQALASEAAAGRQLGFLAQELGREVNTTGSKANDATMQHHVIAMKNELEKFREQLENLA